jgi:hypothetical protein
MLVTLISFRIIAEGCNLTERLIDALIVHVDFQVSDQATNQFTKQ